MGELDSIRADFLTKRPEPWEKLPDLDLYMDQVISMLSRSQLMPDGRQILTAAMVNNYVKEGVLPRSKGKRYSRDHLAYLQIFMALKEVTTVKEAGALLSLYVNSDDVAGRYNTLISMLGDVLDDAVTELPVSAMPETMVDAAIKYALAGYANKMACLRLLDLINQQGVDNKGHDENKKTKIEERIDKKIGR